MPESAHIFPAERQKYISGTGALSAKGLSVRVYFGMLASVCNKDAVSSVVMKMIRLIWFLGAAQGTTRDFLRAKQTDGMLFCSGAVVDKDFLESHR